MNHFLKNPDAHRRLARGANAGVKVRGFSRIYQAGAEFKARQMWLDFKDAVGTALETISASVEASRKKFKQWLKSFRSAADKSEYAKNPRQLLIDLQPNNLTATAR
ncbi:hypothetical protein [Thiobacillus sp.]|uniref:hypothetical protein n=1 Tax=Thiobacillus sp. TaxID=924 RepID=UPI001AD3A102|nr:hypothetical protein [Thiobacillus sp.]MBN8781351.1 hypothetical protein [Thiobacillus sp.]